MRYIVDGLEVSSEGREGGGEPVIRLSEQAWGSRKFLLQQNKLSMNIDRRKKKLPTLTLCSPSAWRTR